MYPIVVLRKKAFEIITFFFFNLVSLFRIILLNIATKKGQRVNSYSVLPQSNNNQLVNNLPNEAVTTLRRFPEIKVIRAF